MAPALAGAAGLPQGRGGRIDVAPRPDGRRDAAASTPSATWRTSRARTAAPHPQLGSVALQSGAWAADNILADAAGKPRKSFHYHDKGIMAMIGRGAAIAEVGPHRHELHGVIAFSAWLGVHAALMTGVATASTRSSSGPRHPSPATADRRCSTAPEPPGSTGQTFGPGRRLDEDPSGRAAAAVGP